MTESVRSLNALSRARVLCDSGAFFGTPSGAPSRTQRVVLDGLVDRIAAYGDRPEVGSPDQALHDVVRIKDLYSQEPSNLAAYSMDRLRVARGRIEPKPVEDLLPPGLTALVKDYKNQILKSERELEADRLQGAFVQPYWDPQLRQSKRKRRELIAALRANNMITFRKVARSKVGMFFVWKKG